MKEQKARNCVKSCKMFASVESFILSTFADEYETRTGKTVGL